MEFKLNRHAVAITSIICCTVLIALGHNSVIVTLLATIIGWYFGRESRKEESEEEK
jgi:ascorbate-specific PTS system EIIC-type component UlaA